MYVSMDRHFRHRPNHLGGAGKIGQLTQITLPQKQNIYKLLYLAQVDLPQ
jgi:hypothetical protein